MQQDDENFATQNSPRKRNRNLPLLPCTILQVHNAQQIQSEDDEFLIDGQLIYQVCIVALISKTNNQTNQLNYELDDATGVLDVRIWMDPEPPYYIQSQTQEWSSGRYVRVIGYIKAFQSKRTLITLRLNIVEDPNEIIYHHLECIHVHMKNTLLNTPPPVPPPVHHVPHQPLPNMKSQNSQPGFRGGSNSNFKSPNSHKQNFQTSPAQSYLQPVANILFNKTQQAIMDTLKTGHKQTGMNIKDCLQKLKQRGITMSEQELRKSIQFLCEEGHLYSTINEHHYAPTGGDKKEVNNYQ